MDAAPRVALAPSRPNPFNPVTTIAFELAHRGHATLRIFDVHGMLVRTLVDATLPAGRFQSKWNGRDQADRPAASGVYFSELVADGTRLTRKMSLLK